MKALRLLAIGVVLLLIAAATAYLLRLQIAGALVTRAMANAGLENPQASVSELSFRKAGLDEISAGPSGDPAFAVESVDIVYDWRKLLKERRIEAILIDGATLRAEITESGDLELPVDLGGDAENPAAALVIGRVALTNAVLRLATPDGDVALRFNGDIDEDGGGNVSAVLEARAARIGALRISEADGRFSAQFNQKNQVTATGEFTGDASFNAAQIDDVNVALVAAATPWRALLSGDYKALSGKAQITLGSASVARRSVSALSTLVSNDDSPVEGAINVFSASGELNVEFSPTELVITLPASGAPSITTDRGDKLSVQATDKPLYQRTDSIEVFAADLRLEGPASGALSIAASRAKEEPWRITGTTRFADQAMFGASIDTAELSFVGDYLDGRALGQLDAAIDFKRIEIGRLSVRGAPTALNAPVRIDLENALMQWGDGNGGCLTVKRAAFSVSEQPLTGSINGSSLCARGGPLLEVGWGEGQTRASLAGRLLANSGMVRFGETSFRGEPPKIDLAARYAPETQSTTVDGVFSGGNVIVNEALRFSGSRGLLKGALIGDDLGADIRLDDALISAFSDTPLFSPVKGEGDAELRNDIFSFDYKINTTRALPLGSGDGVHDVRTGVGKSVFRTQTLRFLPDGLQPEMLSPLLRGPISDATGAIDAVFNVDWDKAGLRTGGDIDFQEVTFRGPGLAVSQTANINGSLALTSLLPVITDGAQSLRIGVVDLNALKLENGEVRFALPGDETLTIVKAEFPWFDGVIGAYDATTPLSGGDAKTVLRASGVDLGALLAFLDVDGLSGEGEIEGSLPLTFDGGRARVTQGALSASGPGVLRYTGDASKAADGSSAAAAFEVLRELRFNKLTVGVDGPLDGTLKFSILIEGYGDFPFETGNIKQTVNAPITYRISLNAPLLALIQQARMTADFQLQQSQIRERTAPDAPETTDNP